MVSNDNSDAIFTVLLQDPSNSRCFDCDSEQVDWASVSHGSFLCSLCAGVHRGLGAHISFIRSITVDEWSHTQVKLMQAGGNSNLRQFFDSFPFPDRSIHYIYRTKAAKHYRSMLKSRADGLSYNVQPPTPEDGISLDSHLYSEPEENKLTSIWKKVVKKGKEIGSTVGEKYTKFKQSEKYQNFEQKTSNFYQEVKVKTKEFSERPAVVKAKEKTVQACGYVADKTKDAYQSVKANPKVQELKQKLSDRMRGNKYEVVSEEGLME